MLSSSSKVSQHIFRHGCAIIKLLLSTDEAAGRDLGKKRRRDPYAAAQSAAKRKANLSRQEVLRQERAIAAGDPVRGVETAFLRSFDSPPAATADEDQRLSFSLKRSVLDASVARSAWLTTPTEEALRAELGPAHVVGEEVASEIIAERKAVTEKTTSKC
ncbi:hypothetical protein MRB53_041174 [Persea americana]|nr:hypothetical protein MRB53_041174 [Persea americana]